MKHIKFFLAIVMLANFSVFAGNVFETKVGNFRVFLLSEGQQKGNKSILIGATDEMLAKAIPDGSFPNAVNAFLVCTGRQNILIDTGFGRNLFANLRECGVDSAKIDIVLITHAHGDHIGGLVKNGKATFPHSIVYFADKEYDYWLNANNQNFKDILSIYGDRIKIFENNELEKPVNQLVNGIFPIAAYGHTPGHTAFLLQSNNEKLLVWGDLAHAMAIQMPYPQVAVTYDVNPEEAVKSRRKILNFVAAEKIPIAGMHIAFPAMGRIEQEKNGFNFIPF